MKQQVVLLNGPSSSGKSTLAQALRALISEKRGEEYAVVSIDDFMKIAKDETIYEDDVFEISGDMCSAVLAALRKSPGVIVDHVITSERIFAQLRDALALYRLRPVRVSCPPEVLRAREAARGDRCPGSAEASDTNLYPKDGYELCVDTHRMSAAACAQTIYEKLLME